MALTIFGTKRADKKLDQIQKYLVEKRGEVVAKAFTRKVYDFPEIGTLENKEKGISGFTIVKQVNLFYRIKEDKIILLTFFDNRQNPKRKKFKK
ncbi:MAG: type II toxin-antitoxin system RelE/ParE family toxin [Chlorobi bacterium]|nr:type II toxin-antitoxin system RelE/ParE family toxin [Chlorobiota bacterium]